MKPHMIFALHAPNVQYCIVAILIVLTILTVLYHTFVPKSIYATLAYGILSFGWAFTIMAL